MTHRQKACRPRIRPAALLVVLLPMVAVAFFAWTSRSTVAQKAGDQTTRRANPSDKARDKQVDRNNAAPDGKPDRNRDVRPDRKVKKPDSDSSSDRSASRFSKYRLSPDEVSKIVDLVQKDDPALANKLRRIMSMQARRMNATDRPTPTPGKKPAVELTTEQIHAAIEIFRDRDPKLGEKIANGFKENPERVKHMLVGQWSRLERMIAMKKNDPRLYQAQTQEIQSSYQIYRLAAEIRQAKPGVDTASLRQTLRGHVSTHLEARRQVRELELERLRERVNKLEKQIKANEGNLDRAIDARVKDLLKNRPNGPDSRSAKSSKK